MTIIDLVMDKCRKTFVPLTRWIGVRIGVVTTPPSKDPIKHDRLRANFENLPKDQQSDYVRMLSLGQGYKCGIFFPPHLDDEVVLFANQGDPHRLYYLTHTSDSKPPPDEHVKNGTKPEERWMLRTFVGHKAEFFDDPLEKQIHLRSADNHDFIMDDVDSRQRIEIETTAGHDILMDDVPGQQKIKITETEGRYIDLNTEQNWIDCKTLTGNRFRLRDSQQDILLEHPSGSYIWFKPDGDVILHAEKTLTFTSQSQVNWPESDLTWKIPATTHKCVEEGTDFISPCPAPQRETKCFNCETGEETGENPGGQAGSTEQYEHSQTTPSDTWQIQHNKGKYPQITAIDENGFVVPTSIRHIDKNNAEIYFGAAKIGKAVCD